MQTHGDVEKTERARGERCRGDEEVERVEEREDEKGVAPLEHGRAIGQLSEPGEPARRGAAPEDLVRETREEDAQDEEDRPPECANVLADDADPDGGEDGRAERDVGDGVEGVPPARLEELRAGERSVAGVADLRRHHEERAREVGNVAGQRESDRAGEARGERGAGDRVGRDRSIDELRGEERAEPPLEDTTHGTVVRLARRPEESAGRANSLGARRGGEEDARARLAVGGRERRAELVGSSELGGVSRARREHEALLATDEAALVRGELREEPPVEDDVAGHDERSPARGKGPSEPVRLEDDRLVATGAKEKLAGPVAE